MSQIAEKNETTKKQLNALEGLNAQGIPAYKNGVADYYRGRQIYNSLSDISNASEADMNNIIGEARGYLGNFISSSYEENAKMNKAIGDRATNNVARLQGAATSAGLSKNSTILQQNDVMSQAQLQQAQNTSTNQQRIYQAANQFTANRLNASSQNITNQANLANLAYTHEKGWNDPFGNAAGDTTTTSTNPSTGTGGGSSSSASTSTDGSSTPDTSAVDTNTTTDTEGSTTDAIDYGEPGSTGTYNDTNGKDRGVGTGTIPRNTSRTNGSNSNLTPSKAPSSNDIRTGNNQYEKGQVNRGPRENSYSTRQVRPVNDTRSEYKEQALIRDTKMVEQYKESKGGNMQAWEYDLLINEAMNKGNSVQASNFRELKKQAGY